MGALVSAIAFPHPPRGMSSRDLQARKDLVFLETNADGGDDKPIKIPAIYIQYSKIYNNNNPLSQFTILYSHGNAEDIGLLLPYLDHMAYICQCSVLAYEYPGYSLAEGEPSEDNCNRAIRAAYQYLLDQGVSPTSIVLFGRSLGSGPTVDLCSQLAADQVAGCILQSPLESGIRAFLGYYCSRSLYYLDIFRSYEKAPTITCPVFIMHGQRDEVVPCANGKALYKILQERKCHSTMEYQPMWIPGRGHNNMPETECLQQCRQFLSYLLEKRKR